MVMFTITDVSEVAPTCSTRVETVDDIGDRKDQGFLEPPRSSPSSGVGALLKEQTEVLCI